MVPSAKLLKPAREDALDGRYLACLALVFLDAVGFGVLIPLLPFVVLDLGGPPVVVTQLAALYGLAGLVTSPFVGALSDRFGRARVVQLTLAGSLVAYFGMLASWSLVGLFLFRTLSGAFAGRSGVLRALATDAVAETQHVSRLGGLAGAHALGQILGPVLGGLVGLWLTDHRQYYQGMILVVIASTALTLAASLLMWRASDRPASRASSTGSASARLGAPLWLALIVNTGASYAYGVVLSTTALLGHVRFGWGSPQTGALLGLGALILVGTRSWVIPAAVRRLGQLRCLAVSLALAAPCLLGFGLTQDPVAFVLMMTLFLTFGGATLLIPTALASVWSPADRRGFTMGLVQATGAAATVASAALGGLLFDYVDPSAPHAVGSAVLLACLAVMWLWPKLTVDTR